MTIKGPLNDRFTPKHLTPKDEGHISVCGGGTMKATYRTSYTSGSSKPINWIDDPEDWELYWTFRTTLDVLKC